MSKNKELSIVCFAGNDWWYHNRGLFCPQIMIRYPQDFRVLFVNSLGMRVPSLTSDKYALRKISRKLRSISRFVRKDKKSGMYIMSPLSIPLLGSKTGRKLNNLSVGVQVRSIMKTLGMDKPIFYINCPPAIEVVKEFPDPFVIYERTDIFEEMPGVDKEYIRSMDQELTKKSNLVLYVDQMMFKEGLKVNPNSMLIGHGVDFKFFSTANESDYIPEDIQSIPKPIVGYFGDICDKGFDFELMAELARAMPNVSFVLVGPHSSDLSMLFDISNIYILGQKTYEDIPHYGKMFDVSILPWKVNKWVLHSYPVKIKEYLALGNPYVSIDIPAINEFRDVIYTAKTHDEFISMVRIALKDNDMQKRKARIESVKLETWDNKAQQIKEFIIANCT